MQIKSLQAIVKELISHSLASCQYYEVGAAGDG
jgi:hypothetical protein